MGNHWCLTVVIPPRGVVRTRNDRRTEVEGCGKVSHRIGATSAAFCRVGDARRHGAVRCRSWRLRRVGLLRATAPVAMLGLWSVGRGWARILSDGRCVSVTPDPASGGTEEEEEEAASELFLDEGGRGGGDHRCKYAYSL